jgi:hypothetical protein
MFSALEKGRVNRSILIVPMDVEISAYISEFYDNCYFLLFIF